MVRAQHLDPIPGLPADEHFYFAMRLDPNEFAFIDRDPHYFTHVYTGTAYLADSSGQSVADIGRFSVTQVDVEGALAQRIAVRDVFDTTAVTWGYFEDLYDPRTLDFKPRVLKELGCDGEYLPANLLILDRLVIDPPYRGREFGLKALRVLMQRFSIGAGLIAMKPFPLQLEGEALDMSPEELSRAGLAGFRRGERAATNRLRAYYSRLGFRAIPRTALMAVPTATGLQIEYDAA